MFRWFIELVGLPPTLHSDNHNNFREGLFKKLLQKFGIIPTYIEPHSPWNNRDKPSIGEVKRHTRNLIIEFNNTIILWCFCYEYTADIISLCDTGLFELQVQNPYETVMSYTSDIFEYASFSWFQWSWFFGGSQKASSYAGG